MKKDIIGRKKQLKQLESCLKEKEASLVIVTGRRRVGKTYFINEAFDKEFDFKVTGDYNSNTISQLTNFAYELRRKMPEFSSLPTSWTEAFEYLRMYLSILPKDKRKVVFFDEFPWLDNHASGFLNAFIHFWNDYGNTVDYLTFIICGSSSSWIEDKIINNKGGLYNRHSLKIKLYPFNLSETEEYLISRGINWSRYDIVTAYMALGGIPYYLHLLDPSCSVGENIDNLFFAKDAMLKDEFHLLFRTLFTNSESYVKVVKALFKKKSGLTREEIADIGDITLNGDLSKVLTNLTITGFINRIELRNGKKRIAYYLSDYFTLFYLYFIDNKVSKDSHYWSKSSDNPSTNAWKGLCFEKICFDHIDQIKDVIGISGVITENFSYIYHGDEENRGTQIDMVIKRRDRTSNICEMKFVANEFNIDKDYYLKLQNKKDIYRQLTKTKDTIQMTLVTTYGLVENKYSNIFNNVVTLDDLFDR